MVTFIEESHEHEVTSPRPPWTLHLVAAAFTCWVGVWSTSGLLGTDWGKAAVVWFCGCTILAYVAANERTLLSICGIGLMAFGFFRIHQLNQADSIVTLDGIELSLLVAFASLAVRANSPITYRWQVLAGGALIMATVHRQGGFDILQMVGFAAIVILLLCQISSSPPVEKAKDQVCFRIGKPQLPGRDLLVRLAVLPVRAARPA